MDTIALARFLNQISETETHFDNMSKKVQSIYERRAMQIMLFLMDNGFGSECTDQERLDYFSAGFCSGHKAGGVEEDWIDEAFCEYEKKRQEKSVRSVDALPICGCADTRTIRERKEEDVYS